MAVALKNWCSEGVSYALCQEIKRLRERVAELEAKTQHLPKAPAKP